MGYVTTREAAELLGVSLNKVRYLLQRNVFAEVIRGESGKNALISEQDILNYKKHLELLDTMYSVKEASKLLGFSDSNLYHHYIKKGFFSSIKIINNQYYIAKAEIDNLLEQNKAYYSMTDCKTCDETAEYLGINVETVYRHIAKGAFPNALKSPFYSSSWKIPNSDIQTFKERFVKTIHEDSHIQVKERLRPYTQRKRISPYTQIKMKMSTDYYTVQQTADFFGVAPSTIYVRVREGVFKNVVTAEGLTFIAKNEVHALNHESIKTPRLGKDSSVEERVSVYLLKVKNGEQIRETIRIFKEYVDHLYANTGMREKHALISANCRMLISVSGMISKELHDHSDAEIIDLIASNKHKKQFIGFLNFIQAIKSSQCQFKNKYNYTSKITQRDKQIYSRNEFKKIYQYVKDIQLHREQARLNPEYAETWFYVFMHLTNAWRSADILNFPNIDFSDLSFEHIENAIADGISVYDAQTVVNIVSDQWEKFVINKTKVLNKFLVNLDMVQTAATIFLTIELNRREGNYDSNYLLGLLHGKTKISPFIKLFFQADPTLKPFSSRIANRSLITYFFHSVSQDSKNGDVAHLLAQRLRRHMDQDTVSQYVMNTNEDEYLDETSYNLFRRGHFGWLYNSLVEIAVSKKELDLSTEEKTRIIELYQEQYSPSEIEQISSYFLEQQNKQKSIALEIALLPNTEIEKRLYGIYMGSMPSKVENSQCFYSENCKYPSGNCKTCPYIIPRTHLLISLKNDLVQIIVEIGGLKEHDVFERIRKTHILYKLLGLLNQAIRSFDKEYVNSFIPLKALETSLEDINDKVCLPEGKNAN